MPTEEYYYGQNRTFIVKKKKTVDFLLPKQQRLRLWKVRILRHLVEGKGCLIGVKRKKELNDILVITL